MSRTVVDKSQRLPLQSHLLPVRDNCISPGQRFSTSHTHVHTCGQVRVNSWAVCLPSGRSRAPPHHSAQQLCSLERGNNIIIYSWTRVLIFNNKFFFKLNQTFVQFCSQSSTQTGFETVYFNRALKNQIPQIKKKSSQSLCLCWFFL